MATGQDIADEVRAALNDEDSGAYRWSDAELLRFINAALRQIVMLVPEANVVEEVVATDADLRQALPTGGIKFLGVWNAVTVEEVTARGSAITAIELDALNSSFPSWSPPYPVSTAYDHFAHDPRDPKTFYLYPSLPDMEVYLKYAKLPTELAALANDVSLGGEYQNAIVEYVTYRALTKDGRHGTGPSQRQELWNNFLRALGMKVDSDRRVDPATNRPPGDAHG